MDIEAIRSTVSDLKERVDQAGELIGQLMEQLDAPTASSYEVSVLSVEEVEGFSHKADLERMTEYAQSRGIEVKDVSGRDLKAMLVELARIDAGEEVEDEDALDELALACGIKPKGDVEATTEAIKEFLSSETEADEEAEEEEEAEESEESEESEEEDEKKAPAKKRGRPKKEAVEEEEEESEGESEDADEEEEDDEEVSDKEWAKRLEAYNEAADKPVKTVEKLKALLGDAPWGTPYSEDDEVFCCGLPLEEVKTKDANQQVGMCGVTGTKWVYDDKTDTFKPFKE